MWGDPERAASLQGSDPLATLLFQVCSPAHIAWGDPRWQELLHAYEVWVHMEDTGESESAAILNKAGQSMAKHAAVSGNLASLSLHVIRMLRQLISDMRQSKQSSRSNSDTKSAATADFSKRISRVGKARATAGSMQLLRILCHPVVQMSGSRVGRGGSTPLEEALLYHTRGDLPCDQPSGRPLVHSILDLIVVIGNDEDALQTPEIYDAAVIGIQLLLVLCGTQLYQPFVSSFQTRDEEENYENYILDELLRDESSDETAAAKNYGLFYASSRSSLSYSNHRDETTRGKSRRHHLWTHHSIVSICLQWQMYRPIAPKGSISHYYYTMAEAATHTRGGETMSRDGMYESYLIVHATAPESKVNYDETFETSKQMSTSISSTHRRVHQQRQGHNIILDATKGALVIGSSIIMLPFKLMSLVYGVMTANRKQKGRQSGLISRTMDSWKSNRTRDVLWLSDSILVDLTNCLMLLLVNNRRNGPNCFRSQMSRLVDKRWENEESQSEQALPDLPGTSSPGADTDNSSVSTEDLENERGKSHLLFSRDPSQLNLNFEKLFEAFGNSLHTEIGALMFYTLHQTCPVFAESLAVRSDLDTLVVPLLRTLYFSSSTTTYVSSDFAAPRRTIGSSTKPNYDIRSCPFRSNSQLYVIMIILLLFSQDSSFGRDAFKRISVSHVPWYKERNLRNINLGSILVLTLLRSLMFNLQRLQDAFLLSNCCAILQNISPPVVDIHDYAAMRLVSVTVSVMKKHLKLHVSSTGESTTEQQSHSSEHADDFMLTPLSMYEEVARTLLGVIYHALSPKTIDRNLHLLYAMVYHLGDFNRIFNGKKLYPSKILDRITSTTKEASEIIQEEGARTPQKALNAFEEQMERLQKVAESKRKKERDDITFTYEEEADPEIFFVPYIWETIVCVVTSSTIEWRKHDIQVFDLLEPVEDMAIVGGGDHTSEIPNGNFAENADDLV